MSEKDIVTVVQAHMDGKRIQIRKMGSHQGFRDGKWYDVVNPRWDFDSCDYRIAPEIPELKVITKQCGKCGSFVDESRKPIELRLVVNGTLDRVRIDNDCGVLFREVIA